jgi:hypothetical protein
LETPIRAQLRRCRRRRSGVPARLIATLFAFLSGANKSEIWVIAKSRNKTEDLIQKIKEAMGSFNRDIVAKACKSLRSRIWAFRKVYKSGLCTGILEQSMGAWNQVGIGLSYRLHWLWESIIPWNRFLGSLKV